MNVIDSLGELQVDIQGTINKRPIGADGRVHHSYSGRALLTAERFRGMDLLSPVWHFFDLLPDARGDWSPSRSYAD